MNSISLLCSFKPEIQSKVLLTDTQDHVFARQNFARNDSLAYDYDSVTILIHLAQGLLSSKTVTFDKFVKNL